MKFRVLVVTNMYPEPANMAAGAFVRTQVEELRARNNSVEVLHIEGNKSVLNYLKALFSVFLATLSGNFDIVHAHYGLSGFSSIFRWRTPLVITLHGSDALVGTVQPMISRFACRFADSVIVVSKQISSVISGEVIPCGIDLELFAAKDRLEARSRLNLDSKKKLVLFPFNPNRKIKRYDIAQEVIARLARKGIDCELLVVSNKDNREMPWYYSAADAMILCSDSEGSPTTVKEAVACNLPVVSVDIGDVREILEGDEASVVCNQDVEELACALERVLRTCRKGKRNASLLKYDNRRIMESVVRVYERVKKNG